MRYFYWEPAVPVADFGADLRARAAVVLASDSIRALIGVGAGDDLVYERSDANKHMATFKQTRDFRGQSVIVAGAHATVELEGDTELVYIGTGFRPGITLSDADLAVDEAQAGPVAVAAYERMEQAKGEVTPHLDQGLRVQQIRGKGDRLAYAIHVERAGGEGHSRPFLFFIDAQSGEVLHQYEAWIE